MPSPFPARHETFVLYDDHAQVEMDQVHPALAQQYWCAGIPRDIVERSVAGSMPFCVYDESLSPRKLVGFARVISDKATFAYLCDVFVIPQYRGRGISKWLVERILDHPRLQGLRRFCLLTRDAMGLYERYGFGPVRPTIQYMERTRPHPYGYSPQDAAGGVPPPTSQTP